MSVKVLGGIRSFAERYDVFVVDLWGTLHDGIVAYPGAADALKRLKDKGKRVALLSNAPRRAALAEELLTELGISRDLYSIVMTSGESVHAALLAPPNAWHRKLKGACWHLGPRRDRSVFNGIDIEVLDEPDGAGFCVATGAAMNEERLEDYQRVLDRGLALGLPMICANPDIWVPVGDILAICAGAFAEYYAAQGGDVCWHGKPHAAIYNLLFKALEAEGGDPVDPARTVAIGDGLPTDIAGAADVAIDSALVVGGLHRAELKVNWRGRPNRKALAALLDTAPAKPDYVLRRFAW